MKILVTGGAGFIGTHVTQVLLARGDDVTVIDDFNNRYDPRLKEARVRHLLPNLPASRLVRASIVDQGHLEALCAREQFAAVIHLAAWASVQPSIVNPQIYTTVNVDGTVNVLEAARKSGVERIVFASSSSVYGGLQTLPFRETANVSRPLSPYAATKVAGEIMCATWHAVHHIPITCLRFFTVYGPWGRPEMALFKFTQAIVRGEPVQMRGATTQRDFTYIDDIVQGIVASLDHPRGFAIYNLGESEGIPLPRFIAAIETALGKKAVIDVVPLPPGDIAQTLADIRLAQQHLGYRATTPLEAGVEKFVRWYRDWYVPHFLQVEA